MLASLAELLAKLERGLRAGAVVSSRKSGGDDRGRGKARVGGGPPGKDPSKRCASKEPRAFRSASRGPCSLAGSKGSSPGPPFAPRCPDFLGPPNALRRPLPAPGVPSDPDRLASPFLRPNLALPESESLNFSSRRLAFSPNRSMLADLGPAAPFLPRTLQCFGQRPGSGSPGLGFLGYKQLTGAQQAAQVPGARDPEACPSERVRARLARPKVAAALRRSVHASARATARRPGPARPAPLALTCRDPTSPNFCLPGRIYFPGRAERGVHHGLRCPRKDFLRIARRALWKLPSRWRAADRT